MKKQLLNNILLALFAVLLCVLVGEVVVRSVVRFVPNYDYEMWRYASDLKQPLSSDRLPFHHYPNKSGSYYGVEIKTNSLGLRDREYGIPKPAGVSRIIVLGDSFALGWGVPVQETIVKQLERSLNGSGRAVEVINMGTGNFNSAMEVELFKQKGLGLEPDVVVLLFFANDVEPTPRLNSLSYRLFSSLYVPGYVADRTARLFTSHDDELMRYYQAIYDPAAPALALNTEAVRALIGLCGARRIKLLIVNIPDLRKLREYPFPFATEHIRKLAEDAHVPFLDLLPVLASEPETSLWVSPEDPHMNSRGNAFAAAAIQEKIRSEHLLGVSFLPADAVQAR